METTIKPTLLFSVLCDDVRREDNGKFILLGLFETIGSKVFPVNHPTLFVMNCWAQGIGQFSQRTKIITPDGQILAQDMETTFKLDSLKAKHRVIARFNNLLFEREGEYPIEVTLDAKLCVRYSLVVEKHSAKDKDI